MTARTRHDLRALLSLALVSSLVLGACGSVVRAASAGLPGTMSGGAQVIRDPDNPAFVGAARSSDAETTTQRIVRDPDNPYWSGGTLTSDSYAEPLHGPR